MSLASNGSKSCYQFSVSVSDLKRTREQLNEDNTTQNSPEKNEVGRR